MESRRQANPLLREWRNVPSLLRLIKIAQKHTVIVIDSLMFSTFTLITCRVISSRFSNRESMNYYLIFFSSDVKQNFIGKCEDLLLFTENNLTPYVFQSWKINLINKLNIIKVMVNFTIYICLLQIDKIYLQQININCKNKCKLYPSHT